LPTFGIQLAIQPLCQLAECFRRLPQAVVLCLQSVDFLVTTLQFLVIHVAFSQLAADGYQELCRPQWQDGWDGGAGKDGYPR